MSVDVPPLAVADRQPDFNYGHDILVVDDDQRNHAVITTALAPLGRKVVFSTSRVRMLEGFLERDFVLIILDVTPPEHDALETARLVRRNERNRATPIIFVIGSSWQDDAVLRGYNLGAFDILIKPLVPEVLRARATMIVQLQERTIELQQKAEELRREQARTHERELLAQRKRFEAEVLEQKMQQMAETDRRKDEFLAILSHELRNPLQPLQTAVEVLERDPEAPVPARIRGIIQRQIHHVTRLVDDMLDIARLNAGKLELRREPASLEEIIDEAVQTCRSIIDKREHQLEIRGSALPVMVYGDPIRLVQVVCNFLNNAAKYTDPRGRILVEWGTDAPDGFIRVTDNGKGISSELLPTMFDMFVQERTEPSGAGGLGLGLGLVKRLVDMHGGSVTATSSGPGRGSTFEMRIALAQPLGDARTRTGSRLAVHSPLRAVVCDDAPDLRELVADLLRLRGHQVTVVEDGPSAIEVIAREHPDVALIDIGLPDMDGYAVARQIRASLGDHQPRLIAMTGYGQASDRAAAFEAGFDAHIVKPASAEKILRALYDNVDP